MFTIGAFGVILNNDHKVLLCHRCDRDLWDLPGGMVELGESPWDGVIREVKEETGLEVVVERLVGIYSKKKKNDIIFSFLCKEIGGEITLNDEADAIEYFSTEKLPQNLSPKHEERIRDVIQNMPNVFLRVQSDKSGWELVQELNCKSNKR